MSRSRLLIETGMRQIETPRLTPHLKGALTQDVAKIGKMAETFKIGGLDDLDE